MLMEEIILEHCLFEVKEKPTKNGSYTCIVYNEKPGDVLQGAALTFFLRNYGTDEAPRYWCPRPAFLNVSQDLLTAIIREAKNLDKMIINGEQDTMVAGGRLRKVSSEIPQVSLNAIQSSNNMDNTVIYWTVTNVKSPFCGLTSQFVIINSKKDPQLRYPLITGKLPGTASFNRIHFCGLERMSPVRGSGDKQSVNIKDARWVSAVNNPYEAIGYLVQHSMVKAISEIFEEMNAPKVEKYDEAKI